MNLSQAELREILSASGLPGHLWTLPDETYETVSFLWVRENWEWWLEARPDELVIFGDAAGKRIRIRPTWLTDSSDCDNLAIGTVAHAQVGNALTAQKTKQPRGGLAYGFLFYIAHPARETNYQVAGPHAINWFVEHDKQVRFFEPGVGYEVGLSATEKGCAWFGLAS